ncbi:hypothetical protein A3K55_02570 [Candidatus Shapirobacteria bacterium RBG_13_44_7]|uniref:RNase H type-1 domain-containing protein n=1 Tax=Candidatus Shapirobacteria bacterium RBG_13_44_7 TaxID=1802149 RepID=A0A1F7SJZ8_9BACT|nr:MAG: hypothetical protein A3K55_02570 [Candidatus Shapirobacteria bacterium RBG_13_44_7]
MEISVYTDGGARGNPGPAGYGLVVYDQSHQILYQEKKFLGVKTNNEAEYLGLIAALAWVQNNSSKFSLHQITFYSDSELLVRQILGLYKVKSKNLKPLFATAQNLFTQINLPYQFRHVLREGNSLADKLANQAMDLRP